MSKRKRTRQQQRHARASEARRGRFTASHVFLALIVLIIAVFAAVALLGEGRRPTCPPGQVWSDEHNHCH